MSKATTEKKRPTRTEVFWSRVAPFNHRSRQECALWLGHRLPGGYGILTDPETGKQEYAHRCSWMLKTGKDIPSGYVVRHTCHEPSCVRPSHLEIGTPGENQQDRTLAGRGRTMPVLSATDIEALRWSYATERWSQGELAELFYGTRSAQPHVARIVQGRTYSGVGGPIVKRGRGNRAARRQP
jgi:hypothetical protein